MPPKQQDGTESGAIFRSTDLKRGAKRALTLCPAEDTKRAKILRYKEGKRVLPSIFWLGSNKKYVFSSSVLMGFRSRLTQEKLTGYSNEIRTNDDEWIVATIVDVKACAVQLKDAVVADYEKMQRLREDNKALRSQLSEKDEIIRALQEQLSDISSAAA